MKSEQKWVFEGSSILEPNKLKAIRGVLTDVGPVIVEHRHYFGSRAPSRHIVEEHDVFIALLTNASPGDNFYVWSYETICTAESACASGKVPNELGQVPTGGAY